MTNEQLLREASPREVDLLFKERHKQVCAHTDRDIAMVMCIQWIGAIIAALLISPQTWQGASSSIHPHLVAALYFGGLITIFPVYLALRWPGERFTRHIAAASQMMMSGLLIHISGGRIETHFHIFGSLTFLAFYLDWEVLLTATATVALHHALFAFYVPASIFGTSTSSGWRLLEHVLWVVFFDIFLIVTCIKGVRSVRNAAKREANHIYRAHHDPLTGLANRSLLQKTFAEPEALAPHTHKRFVLMAMDLDRFKQVNDTLGHQVGDFVLIEVARRMSAVFSSNDLLARIGGDEFAALVYAPSSLFVVESIASRIVNAITDPIFCGEHIIHIGISIGICPERELTSESRTIKHDEAALADLLHCADLALYKVKNTGRNRHLVFEEGMRARSLKDMGVEYRLRNAIQNQAFHLHYQPIVSSDGVLLGFEALLRWDDGANGKVAPSDFLPIAEETGLIVPLGEWVIREACTQAAGWHRSGNKVVRMSVNVSARQLTSESFVGNILRSLVESELPPELLCLEITDTALIQSYDETAGALRILSNYGVHLSIDDFAVSHSAWMYPAGLPIHTLKIDRAITTRMASSSEAIKTVEDIIHMAHGLRLRVVAKGVESREQLEQLRAMGCDEIQGFHISQAVSPEGARALMNACAASAPSPA